MFDTTEIQDLAVIAAKAIEEMHSQNFKNFFIKAIRWDNEDDELWCVDFYTENGNSEYVTVSLERCLSGRYRSLGIYGSEE